MIKHPWQGAGLHQSTEFVAEGLRQHHIEAKVVDVIDGNYIDNAIFTHQPNIVILEALWATPSKMKVIKELYPKIKFFVHLHSNIPFLALEGCAIEWLLGYDSLGIGVIANSKYAYQALKTVITTQCFQSLTFLPNVYTFKAHRPIKRDEGSIHIGCFGAIRPMKNQLIQAMAAIEFARRIGKYLYFYVNSSRIETGGDNVLKNLRALFLSPFTSGILIEDEWRKHDNFVSYLRTLDFGMQVSMSETFNITSADYTAAGLPMVVSDEIPWASRFNRAKVDDIESITDRMLQVYKKPCLVRWNQTLLSWYSADAIKKWVHFIRGV